MSSPESKKPSVWQNPFDYICWWYSRRVVLIKQGVWSPSVGWGADGVKELAIYEGIREWSKNGMPMYQAVIYRKMARVLEFREKVYGLRI